MVRRHVDDLSLDEAMLVLKTACLLKFTGDVWRETDNNKRIFMTMLEFGGNRMLFARSVELGSEMDNKATSTSDMLEVAAVGAACEAAGFH